MYWSISLCTPKRITVSFVPEPRPFPDVTADIRNELEDIREEESLEPETIDELAEELRRIEAAADPANPGAALDAAERLRERVAALLDLNDETLRRLAKDMDPLARAADPEGAEELRRMLSESSTGSLPNGEESSDDAVEGYLSEDEGDGGGEGEGDGSPSRGRGDAPMAWGDPVALGDSKYRDESREATPDGASKTEKVGESVSKEDPAVDAPRRASSGAAPGGRSAGTSLNRAVSPRHRGTVRRFFETERQQR